MSETKGYINAAAQSWAKVIAQCPAQGQELHFRGNGDAGWPSGKRYCQPRDIENHFAGRKKFAIRAGRHTAMICWDLDAQTESDADTIGDRLVRLCVAIRADLGVDPAVCRSPGGGYHVYVGLSRYAPRTLIQSWAMAWTDQHVPGLTACDYYPSGTPLRLPMGEGQQLTDCLGQAKDGGLRAFLADFRASELSISRMFSDDELIAAGADARGFFSAESGMVLARADRAASTARKLARSRPKPSRSTKPTRKPVRKPVQASKPTSKPTKAKPAKLNIVTVEKLSHDQRGPVWIKHVDDMIDCGLVETGSTGVYSSIRQIVMLSRVTRDRTPDDVIEIVASWADLSGVCVDSAVELAKKRIVFVQAQDYDFGRPCASAVVGRSVPAKVIAPKIIAGCEDAIIAATGATNDRVIDACYRWIDAISAIGVANDDHPKIKGRITIDGQKRRLAVYARELIQKAGYLTRVKGHCAGVSKAIYGFHFARVATLRVKLGLEAVTFADDQMVAREQETVSAPWEIEVIDTTDISAAGLSRALVTDRVRAEMVSSGPDDLAMTDMIVHGWTTRENHSLPTVKIAGQSVLDLRAVRAVRQKLDYPAVSVRLSTF